MLQYTMQYVYIYILTRRYIKSPPHPGRGPGRRSLGWRGPILDRSKFTPGNIAKELAKQVMPPF